MSGIYQQYFLEESDSFGIVAGFEEGEYVYQDYPVYKDAFSSKGGELYLPTLQFPQDIFREGLQLFFAGETGQPHDRIKHRRVIRVDKMVQW